MKARLSLLAALALAASLAVSQAVAGGATGMQTIASHLNNPRGVAVGPDGSVYVAEAGAGGKAVCQKGPEGTNCAGFTGAIVQVRDAQQSVYASGFISGGDPSGNFATGVDGITASPGGTVYGIVTAFGPNPNVAGPRGAGQLGQAVRIDRGGKTSIGNVAAYEFKHNPTHDNVDSDPYGIAWTPGGLLVTDAAGNDLLRVGWDGRVTTVATFLAQRFGKFAAQSVPTSVAVGPDGAYYVGELGGGGTPPGHSRIWRVVPGQKATVWKTGFSAIDGLAFGPDGSLYVSELARGGLGAVEGPKPDFSGAVIRVSPDGRRTELAAGKVMLPGGIAVGRDDTVYVSTWSVFRNRGALVAISQ
jgi:hypothetical protein